MSAKAKLFYNRLSFLVVFHRQQALIYKKFSLPALAAILVILRYKT
jgi:hypothetical protein